MEKVPLDVLQWLIRSYAGSEYLTKALSELISIRQKELAESTTVPVILDKIELESRN